MGPTFPKNFSSWQVILNLICHPELLLSNAETERQALASWVPISCSGAQGHLMGPPTPLADSTISLPSTSCVRAFPSSQTISHDIFSRANTCLIRDVLHSASRAQASSLPQGWLNPRDDKTVSSEHQNRIAEICRHVSLREVLGSRDIFRVTWLDVIWGLR